MGRNKLLRIIMVLVLSVSVGLSLSSCAFIEDFFGGGGGGEEGGTVRVTGSVYIDGSVGTEVGYPLYVGFFDFYPQGEESVPNPIPFADFSGSSKLISNYSAPYQTYSFTF